MTSALDIEILKGPKCTRGCGKSMVHPTERSVSFLTCASSGCALQQCQGPSQSICRHFIAGNPVLTDTHLQGDTIGCFIHMPEGGRRLEKSKAVSHTYGALTLSQHSAMEIDLHLQGPENFYRC